MIRTKIKVDGINGFKKAYKKEQEELKRKQKEQDFNNKGILTQAKISEERFLKAFKKYKKIPNNIKQINRKIIKLSLVNPARE